MDISSKQKQILDFMIRYQQENGSSPSVREICNAVGLSSTSTVHGHLSRLEAKGYIRRDPARPRSIEIVRQPEDADLQTNDFNLSEHRSEEMRTTENIELNKMQRRTRAVRKDDRSSSNSPVINANIIAVPVLSGIHPGEPLLSVENIQDYYPLPAGTVGNGDCFMIHVSGESMVNAGIYDGDLILVRSQRTAANHDIVVALLGDSVTVKTYYKERDYIRLQPENNYMEPILLKSCSILGKVIGLYRSLY